MDAIWGSLARAAVFFETLERMSKYLNMIRLPGAYAMVASAASEWYYTGICVGMTKPYDVGKVRKGHPCTPAGQP